MFDFNPDRLFVEPPAPPRTPPPEPDDYQALDAAETVALLDNNGVFAAFIPNYECRDGQLEMVRHVTTAFNNQQHLMVEAGTGTGKSMAYLVPAVQWAQTNNAPVVISTNTKNLQSQLFDKDLPLIRKVLGHDFSIAIIKGRANYICLRKLMQMIEHADYEIRPADAKSFKQILSWVKKTRSGDFAELGSHASPATQRLATTIVSTAEECAGRACRHYRQCFLMRARARSQRADIVIANHSLVFAEMGNNGQSLPPYNHLILDEAHNLEEAATRHFSIEISAARLRFPLRRLGRAGKKSKGLLADISRQTANGDITDSLTAQTAIIDQTRAISKALHNLEKKSELFFETLAAFLKKQNGDSRRLQPADKQHKAWQTISKSEQALRSALAVAGDSIATLTSSLRELPDETSTPHSDLIRDLDAQRALLLELSENLDFVLSMENNQYVYWIEPDGTFGDSARAWAAPVSIGELLHDELYQNTASVIFVSATLSVNNSFNFIKHRLGIDRIDDERLIEFDAGSPFDHRNQCMMIVPMFLPEPGNGDGNYTEAMSQLLSDLFRRIQGRGLVLFTSYAMLRQTTAILRENLDDCDIDVLAQGEGRSREALAKQFRDDISSILLGTHSFWEGVDVIGESLSCVVLARLPFAVYTEPITAARCEEVEAAGGNAFANYSIPNAVIKFRQGFGRLIRHREDRGIVIAADRRIVTKRYGHWFRRSVPANITKCYTPEEMLDTIAQFLTR